MRRDLPGVRGQANDARSRRDIELTKSDFAMAAVICGALWAAPPALAQSPPGTNDSAPHDAGVSDEVVVTARKWDERLQDVPVSIAVIEAKAIKDGYVQRIDDIGTLAPNLVISGASDTQSNVVLRGVGAYQAVEGVGFYLNDVQQFEGQSFRLKDLERIEVLRGPQGTLYGGSNIGGAIKYTTRRASQELEAEFTAEVGQRDTQNLTAILSGPLSDTFGARLVLFDDHNDGFLANTATGRTIGDLDFRGARLTLDYDNGGTGAVLYLDVSREELDTFVPFSHPPDDRTYLRTTQYNESPPQFSDRKLASAILQIDQDVGDLTFTALSSALRSGQDNGADLDWTGAPLVYVDVDVRKSVHSQEFRLTSSGAGAFKWLLGAFYQQREQTSRTLTSVFFINRHFPGSQQRHVEQYALFGNATYARGPWTFEAGLRGERDDNDNATPGGSPAAASRETSEILPRISFSYRLNEHLNSYASITRGLTPGGTFGAGGDSFAFDPETTMNYELGIKGAVGGRVSFDAAVFYVDYQDRLFVQNIVDPVGGILFITRNIGASTNYGLETSVAVSVTDRFKLSGAFALLESAWDGAVVADPNTGNTPTNLVGLTPPNSPEYQGTLTAAWESPIVNGLTLGLRADAAFVGRQFWNLTNTRQQRPYAFANLSARLGGKHWELSTRVQNVFDQRYNVEFYTGPEVGLPFDIAYASLPRLWTAQIAFRY